MKRHHRETANLFQELIVDNFAGGGGASEGIAQALGCDVDIAVNHDRAAILMHEANHPRTRHLCEDVFKVDPDKVCGGKRVRLLWLSPDCKHFSRAKGSKPVSKKIRGLAWVAVKWAKAKKARPRIICLENVREFEDWGPLTADNMPCPVRKGLTFRRFVGSLRNAGYEVEWKTLNAADFGAPTHRRRLFLIARCDGRAIIWPEPTHGPTNAGSNRHRKDVAEKSNQRTTRSGDRCEQHRERDNLNNNEDGSHRIEQSNSHTRRKPSSAVHQPIGSVEHRHLQPYRTAAECIDFTLPCPSIFLTKEEAKAAGVKRPLAEKTMRRIAMGLKRYVLDNPNPFIVRVEHGGDHFRGQSIDKPLRTVSAKHGYGIVDPTVAPFLAEVQNASSETGHRAVDRPAHTVTANPKGGGMTLVAPVIARQNHGEKQWNSVEDPTTTVTSQGNKHGLVSAFLASYYGEAPHQNTRGQSVDEPLRTVTPAKNTGILVAPQMVKFRGDSKGTPADAPLPTITSGDGAARPAGAAHAMGIAVSHLTQFRGTNKGNGGDPRQPMPAVTAQGNHIAEVRAFLIKYFGKGVGATCDEPMHTVTSRDRFGLVTVEGIDYQIVDIGLRMLTPRELARAQGFPETYILTGSKSSQVARIGNSVPPPVVAAIVRANCGEQREAVSA